MKIPVEAVYEGDGILRLKQPVSLKENTSVRLTIEELEQERLRVGGRDDQKAKEAVADLVGCISETPTAPAISEEHDEILYR